MPKGKKYHISLTDEEKEFLKKCIRAGKHAVRNVTRAGIPPLSSEGGKDSEIAKKSWDMPCDSMQYPPVFCRKRTTVCT